MVTCAASVVALFAVAVGLYLFQLRNFRHTFERELKTLAQIMADNCATALAFSDAKTANEVLSPLAVKPEIRHAAVLGKDGQEFASFGSRGNGAPPQLSDPIGMMDEGSVWMIIQPVIFDGERIGTFYMQVEYAQRQRELQRLYLSVTGGVLATSLVLVVLLTMKLQEFITRPIRLLARASEVVARERDYSVRVERASQDELGQLTGAFNEMLARIQEQASALHSARSELQRQVIALEAEITERKAAEARVADLNRQLVETSRQAGMAEVATGVLHNVGNVLNSVNIAASTVVDKLRASKVVSLSKAVGLMDEHSQNLGTFLLSDPQGQRLPGYFRKLSAILTDENATVRAELQQLCKNIEHIKEIVGMQQSYARATGFLEDVSPESLVDDALDLNRASFDRHRIRLIKKIHPVPNVRVDKHKVLQILTNLVQNAKHAIEDAAQVDPLISISVSQVDERVRIDIHDNGIGIPPENLTRIFQHGFTTKKNGHGFGLHSGANAAQEMGGVLVADSQGVHHGATFTLELPITANTREQ